MNIMITVVQNYSFTEIIAGISIIIDFAKLILFEVGVVIWLIIVDFVVLYPVVAQQEADQVIAFAGCFQFTEQVTDVLSKVVFVVLAIFDNWVHSLVFVPICLDNDYLQRWNYPFWQQCGEMDTYGLQATVDE